jgi:hypothetical protein
MSEEQEVNQVTLNPDGETTTETVEGEDELVKTKEIAKNQKIRAEKAETELKRLKAEAEAKKPKETEAPKKTKYSLEEIDEISTLTSIPREDRAEVLEYADRKGIKTSEALNTPFIKTFLREQEEQRKTALAANTGTVKRGSSKSTDEAILEKFASGNLPDNDVDMAKLAEARMNQKLKGRKL